MFPFQLALLLRILTSAGILIICDAQLHPLVLTLLLKKVVFVFFFSHLGYLMKIDNYFKLQYLLALGYFGILFALRKD